MDQARQQLEQVPGLLHRMASLMGLDFHGEVADPDTVELVMEHMWKYNQNYHISQGVRQETPSTPSSLHCCSQRSEQRILHSVLTLTSHLVDIMTSVTVCLSKNNLH